MKVKRERGWTGHSWGGISLGPPDPAPNGGKRAIDCLQHIFVSPVEWIMIVVKGGGGSGSEGMILHQQKKSSNVAY